MGSASEDDDDDDPPHLRATALGLGVLGPNGPDSAGGPLGTSDISVQSMSTDSKNTHDDSDQVRSVRRSIINLFSPFFTRVMNGVLPCSEEISRAYWFQKLGSLYRVNV